LLTQVYENALLFYHHSEISRKGNRFSDEVKKVHIAIINSCTPKYINELSKIKFELLIIDEAHHSYSPSYQRLINSCKCSKILGITATPDRSDGKFIQEILSNCSFKISIQELIKSKFLCDIEGYSVKTKIDLSNIDDHNGDFNIKQLFEKLGTEERNQLIVNICKEQLADRKTLVFCINIEHSKQMENLLNKEGIIARHIDGKMNRLQRSSIISGFRQGKIQVITNCKVLTEGFDEPSINGILLARPTKSRSLFIQMIGRGLRIHEGKNNCKIIDVVDNHKRLANFTGLISDNEYLEKIDKFSDLEELEKHVQHAFDKILESRIVRADLINYKPFDDLQATDSIEDYLRDNDIEFYLPLRLEEGCFLVWKNELKKRLA
jgi:superfamily II DNA or RNA helicase